MPHYVEQYEAALSRGRAVAKWGFRVGASRDYSGVKLLEPNLKRYTFFARTSKSWVEAGCSYFFLTIFSFIYS